MSLDQSVAAPVFDVLGHATRNQHFLECGEALIRSDHHVVNQRAPEAAIVKTVELERGRRADHVIRPKGCRTARIRAAPMPGGYTLSTCHAHQTDDPLEYASCQHDLPQ